MGRQAPDVPAASLAARAQPSRSRARAVERLDLQVLDGVVDQALERLALEHGADGREPPLASGRLQPYEVTTGGRGAQTKTPAR